MDDAGGTTQNTYQIGDTVVLLSGGPLMTVSETRGDRVTCIWFAADETLCSAEIPFVCIEAQGVLDFMGGSDDDEVEQEETLVKKKKKKKKHDD